ncbi:alpha/beta fold hydrolase [Maritimibacter sp. DP1N21-5]|uniref:alpha/beta fold hydrolase n=1 Tax=Maritimibacter sp. DP1N21-5 TaxID=2836867 RepID=UPI001C4559FA|nr:alpha/beta fold hydrolase [Maritimibacter sp. DP1N21-5]MBV7410937.1 alpha/beta hydrolase [Maritimibacter sp. DP1N21-5]
MAIVLIPGLLCDRYCWEPVLDHLSEATVADVGSQDSITQMATDCLALSEGLLEVAGHSMGARVAMEMARLAPNRVQRLVLMDTGFKPLKDGEVEKRAEIVAFGHEHGMEALAARWLPPMVHEPNQTPELMGALTDMVLRSNPERHERQIHALVTRPDAEAYLPRIACPTLVVVGRQDQWSPPEQHEEIMALLPNARMEIVENAGHFAPVEQPDVVGPMVASFLKGDA